MPAVARRAATRQVNYANSPSPYKASPTKVDFNDDHLEKQFRRDQHLKDAQPSASPVRKMNNRRRRPRDSDVSLSGSEAATPIHTPKQSLAARAAARRSISGAQTVPLRGDGPSTPITLNPVNSTAITPLKRVPILANFEEWMKLATDNKINATNSWNFALIDYFHDMSLLREGDGVNFQKASCTLDGCVKIYTSRVDSVATETGRLLSGLADSNSGDEQKKRRKGDGEGEDDEEEGEDGEGGEDDDEEGGGKKKSKRKQNRSHEATLAPSFASLQLKKLELEFAVDPLFKKASADFDEGGAKGLLLNHLSIDGEGRIVFDSSDDAVDEPKTKSDEEEQEDTDGDKEQPQEEEPDQEIDLQSLGLKFFPNLSILDEHDICPSMKNFKIGDPNAQLTIPFLQPGNDEWKKHKSPEKAPPPQIPTDLQLADQSGLFLDGNALGFDDEDEDDDDNGIGGGFDMGDDVGFGEGGEAWAREVAVEPQLRPVNGDDEVGPDDGEDYALAMSDRYRESAEQETMLAFFGKAFNSRAKVGTKAFSNLANWRIQKIQKAAEAEAAPATKTRKEKEPFQIDFHGPLSSTLEKLLKAEPANNSAISLPKTQLKTKGRNLLDKDDEVIDVKAMMRLWTKPKVRIGKRKAGGTAIIDEGFGARGREQPLMQDVQRDRFDEEEADDDGPQGDYDANFFVDDDPLPFFDGPLPIDDDDDDEGEQPGFVDAREMLSPPPEDANNQFPQGLDAALADDGAPNSQQQGLFPPSTQTELLPGSFGTQLVTQQGRRLRPEYVNFARVAKKVDVRVLKENMWRGMSQWLTLNVFEDPNVPPALQKDTEGDTEMSDPDAPQTPPAHESDPVTDKDAQGEAEVLKFTDILGGLKSVYPDAQMKDISTSYGFICLLHLANEKGLVLEGGREDGCMNEIMVRRDGGVGEGYVGE